MTQNGGIHGARAVDRELQRRHYRNPVGVSWQSPVTTGSARSSAGIHVTCRVMPGQTGVSRPTNRGRIPRHVTNDRCLDQQSPPDVGDSVKMGSHTLLFEQTYQAGTNLGTRFQTSTL